MLVTELRALLRREKESDLDDLSKVLMIFEGLNPDLVIQLFAIRKITRLAGQAISRVQAQERIFDKLVDPRFMANMRPLLSKAQTKLIT